jgi:hypothetical protein
MVDHTIRAFDTDLQQLAGKIAEMGRLDGEQIACDHCFRVIATDDRSMSSSGRLRRKP